MRFEEMKRTASTLEKAVHQIKNNNNPSFKWFAVKNKKNSLFEIGGRNKEDKLEIKAYIPKFENKKYIVYENGFVNSAYSIYLDGLFEFSTFRVCSKKEWTLESYLKFLENTDFKKYYPKIITKEVIASYETIYELNE